MAIIQNLPCPACQERGHDKEGNHLMVFEDGGQLCIRAHHHKSGERYYKKKGDKNPVFTHDINGKINYTPDQFTELEDTGKLKNPMVRLLALSGMKEENQFLVMNDDEQDEMQDRYDKEMKHFEKLQVRNLIDRGIQGHIAKLYNVRTGVNKKGRVARHYYPVYDIHGDLIGAKCRNLPKDFRTGRLGRMWGKTQLFGQQTVKKVAKSGTRKHTLLIVGGECDAMSAQQMLCESRKAGKWESQLFHVWSVQNGESGIASLVDNAKAIRKFEKVIFAFDNDEVGNDLNLRACRLIGESSSVLIYPDGCKDANQCLEEDREEEFVDAWWKSDKPDVSSIKTVADLFDEATEEIEMGLSFPWPTVTEHTFGIRLHNLYTIGGGPGVGKTEVAKEIIKHLCDYHGEKVGVIFMEEPAKFTVRVLAGKWVNKKLHLPKNHHPKGHELWDIGRDYTTEEANNALRDLAKKDRIRIAECAGDTSIDNIMLMCEDLRAMGCKYIFIDNLTTISHKGNEGSVKAIDESMKRIGTYMQTEAVAIFLLSHLAKPQDPRTPFEQGGEVRLGDFRGSQSIAFWSTFMMAVERNTQGDIDERTLTYLRFVKDRLTGMATGEVVPIKGNTKTGRLLEPKDHKMLPKPKAEKVGKKRLVNSAKKKDKKKKKKDNKGKY